MAPIPIKVLFLTATPEVLSSAFAGMNNALQANVTAPDEIFRALKEILAASENSLGIMERRRGQMFRSES